MRQHSAENGTPADERLAWLTRYAVRYRYAGAQVVMEDRLALLSVVTETVEAIIARIRTLTATGEEEPGSARGQQKSSTKPDESDLRD